MSKSKLIQQLREYSTIYKEEENFKEQFIELLTNHANCFERSLLEGHITGSSWILDKSKQNALLLHHAKLDKWLQPGGHADGDSNVEHVALKEATEESGLKSVHLVDNTIFDIDIHTIPERGNVPEHLHYDIRYLFEADKSEPLQINHESKAMKWVKLSEIVELVNGNKSIMRMVEKCSN